MRATVIICSMFSVFAFVVLGGFLNVITGVGFDVAAPYNDPGRVVVTLIGDIPGVIFALFALGFALYVAARQGGGAWFVGLLVWPVIPLLAASLMFVGALAHPDVWFLALACVPLAPLVFAIVAPASTFAMPTTPAIGAERPVSASPARLSIFAGILAAFVLGGAVLLFPMGLSNGAAPAGPPALRVSQADSVADCAAGSYPQVTLTNTGAQTIEWSASSRDSSVTAIPAMGSLAAGASTTVGFSGRTTAPDVIVQFNVSGQTGGVAKFGCQAGVGA